MLLSFIHVATSKSRITPPAPTVFPVDSNGLDSSYPARTGPPSSCTRALLPPPLTPRPAQSLGHPHSLTQAWLFHKDHRPSQLVPAAVPVQLGLEERQPFLTCALPPPPRARPEAHPTGCQHRQPRAATHTLTLSSTQPSCHSW